jgi:hypothetical protein
VHRARGRKAARAQPQQRLPILRAHALHVLRDLKSVV